MIEVIGDSLSQGYTASYEGLSSKFELSLCNRLLICVLGYAYGLAAGLGNTEYSITAFSGICLQDKLCWGHKRGMLYQWYRTSDASGRAGELYGDKPPTWDFKKQQAADIVIINLGTNDGNSYNLPDPGTLRAFSKFLQALTIVLSPNTLTSSQTLNANLMIVAYVAQYKNLVSGVHTIWPDAQVILLVSSPQIHLAPFLTHTKSLVGGFGADGNSYGQGPLFVSEIQEVYKYFNTREYLSNPILYDPVKNKTYASNKPSAPFVHYFNTTGIMQHNDYGPKWHPTDTGHIKLASHLMQYIKLKFDWALYATGPEVLSGTTYWNDQDAY